MQERGPWSYDISLSIAYQYLQNDLKLQTQNISRRKKNEYSKKYLHHPWSGPKPHHNAHTRYFRPIDLKFVSIVDCKMGIC